MLVNSNSDLDGQGLFSNWNPSRTRLADMDSGLPWVDLHTILMSIVLAHFEALSSDHAANSSSMNEYKSLQSSL